MVRFCCIKEMLEDVVLLHNSRWESCLRENGKAQEIFKVSYYDKFTDPTSQLFRIYSAKSPKVSHVYIVISASPLKQYLVSTHHLYFKSWVTYRSEIIYYTVTQDR